jgi:hypothetical protein
MKQLSITTPIVISFCVGLGIVRPHLETFAAAPVSVTKIDFDRVFADATRQGAPHVDRGRKGNRLPNVRFASPKPALLPYCEPVASPYAAPILSRVVGRCAV